MRAGVRKTPDLLTNEIERLLREEIGEDCPVIAAGGQVPEWTGVVDRVEECLTLDSVRLVYADHHWVGAYPGGPVLGGAGSAAGCQKSGYAF